MWQALKPTVVVGGSLSHRLPDTPNTIDANLVASAYGMTNEAVTIYLADNVDPTRLANP